MHSKLCLASQLKFKLEVILNIDASCPVQMFFEVSLMSVTLTKNKSGTYLRVRLSRAIVSPSIRTLGHSTIVEESIHISMFAYTPRQIYNIMLYISKNLHSIVPIICEIRKSFSSRQSESCFQPQKSITIPIEACIHDLSNFIESYSVTSHLFLLRNFHD